MFRRSVAIFEQESYVNDEAKDHENQEAEFKIDDTKEVFEDRGGTAYRVKLILSYPFVLKCSLLVHGF